MYEIRHQSPWMDYHGTFSTLFDAWITMWWLIGYDEEWKNYDEV